MVVCEEDFADKIENQVPRWVRVKWKLGLCLNVADYTYPLNDHFFNGRNGKMPAFFVS